VSALPTSTGADQFGEHPDYAIAASEMEAVLKNRHPEGTQQLGHQANGAADLFGHRRRHLRQTSKRNGSAQQHRGFPDSKFRATDA